MVNATVRQTKQDRSILKKNVDNESISIPATTIAKIKDPKVNKNQRQQSSELKNPISFIQYDSNTQTNQNLDFNYVNPQHNKSHKSLQPLFQQHSPSPTLEESLAIIRTNSPGDPRGYKEKDPDPKQPKLQQYAGRMGVIERFYEIMKQLIEEKKKKPQVMLLGQYKHYPNKDSPLFFYPPKNYRLTPIPRLKDLNLSEEQCEYDGVAGFISMHLQIYQSILEAEIGLITFAAVQIVQSESESKDKEQLTNELKRIIADGTDDNGEDEQSDHSIEPKYFINENDGLRKNDSGTQLQATFNVQANPEINITKISVKTPPYNVNGSVGLGGNGCGTQLQAATNDNGHENHQTIDNTDIEYNYEQANDIRTG
ncbi:MAG: hypothetical protein EZS28_010402 [Streblomastix strix]|uniref:Uncharacterized protein n=1 Tax=Streblomastix strix TaxID=222440 RepID=A0A5J4WIB2_9EUKA|nr:MAG: hypothetical protein EZS28_010402 [Streblomastix strix]